MTKTRNTVLALVGVALLTLSAVAAPAMAKEGRGDHPDERRAKAAEMQAKAEERREAAQAKADLHGNLTRERCMARAENATLNETAEKRCMKHGEFAEKAFKARRASHALLGAINATERIWARLNATEADLRDRLAAGNLTDNETARIEHRLERIDAKQERLEDRLAHLRERLAALHERWDAVRDHVAERREHRGPVPA